MRIDYSWKLPESILVRLGQNTYGRQRTIFEEGHLLLILHRLPEPKESIRESIVFLRTPEGAWLCNGEKDGLFRLKRILASYEGRYAELHKDYSKADDSEKLFKLIEKLTPVSRGASNMLNAIQAAREQVKIDQELIDARDRAYDIQQNFEMLLTDAKSALNFRIARNAQENASAARDTVAAQHRLNTLAAIFFPLMTLTAVFSMNLPNSFHRFGELSFWGVLTGGAILGGIIKNWVVKPVHREFSED